MRTNQDFVIIISADAEWRVIKKILPGCKCLPSPFGEWFPYFFRGNNALVKPAIFMHGGWGKVSAAGSTQYAIDRWHPRMIINLGTCGGFEGDVQRGEIILVEKTVIYDIYEQMGDPEEHIRHYAVDLDISWITDPTPQPVIRSVLVSGDRDLFWKEVPSLKAKYGAIAGDWESGAIAWVASKNQIQCLILRGVTDLVGAGGGEAYEGKVNTYYENTEIVMKNLIENLTQWLVKYYNNFPSKY
jgi:adenosylhomocysteine nucleosidase